MLHDSEHEASSRDAVLSVFLIALLLHRTTDVTVGIYAPGGRATMNATIVFSVTSSCRIRPSGSDDVV